MTKTGYGFVTGGGLQRYAGAADSGTNSGFLPLWWYVGTPMLMVACTPYGAEARATAAVRGSDLAGRSLGVVPGGHPCRGCLPRRNHRHRHTGRRGAGLCGPPPSCLARHAGRRRTADGNGPLRCVPHCAAWAGGCRARYRSKHCSGGRRADGAHLDRSPRSPPRLGLRGLHRDGPDR